MNPVNDRRLTSVRQACFFCYLTLLLSLSVQSLSITELQLQSRVVIWMIQILPLLIFLPGMMRGNYKTYLWLCFALLIYFTVAVANVVHPRAGWLDVTEVILTLLCFVLAMLFARWRQRQILETENN